MGIRDSHLYCNADEKADPLAVCREGALEEDAKSGYPLRSIFGMKKWAFLRVFLYSQKGFFIFGKSQKGETMGYPMSAIVGQEEARLALCLLAVNPAVGGVLLIGGRGVGKSVLARGLKRFCTELWMQAGWTEVPVYINQEQLAGKNGILERAKSSWLYMDEINLLADQAGRT